MLKQSKISQSTPAPAGNEAPTWGWLLSVWMALVVMLNGLVWTTGVVDHDLVKAVENGARRVEERTVGEENRDVIRKAIQLQRDTLPFWTILSALGDFLFEPAWLFLRAMAVAVSFSAVAAMLGRPVRFPTAMAECVAWQGVWVLGLAVQIGLMLALWRPIVDTSILAFLPVRVYTAREYLLLQQLDLFAIVGWMSLAWAGFRRRQSNLLVAIIICLGLALIEAYLRYSISLLVNLSMRLTLFGG